MSKAFHSHLWPGVPLALASAALFGLSAPVSKLLLGTVAPQLLAGLLYLGAGIGLAAIQVGRNAFGIPAPLILDRSQIESCSVVCAWARTHRQNSLKRTSMRLTTAILTKKNSVVISINQKAAKCQNGL